MAADFAGKAASDNGKAAEGIANGELPHGVDEQNFLTSAFCILTFDFTPAKEWNLFAGKESGNFLEAVGMAGGEEKEEVEVEELRKDRFFFEGMGAGDGDGGLSEGEFFSPRGEVDGLGLEIEFEIAGDVEARGVSEERGKTVGVLFVLDAEEIEVGKELFGKWREMIETSGRSGREFAADKGDFAS